MKGGLSFPEAIAPTQEDRPWPETVQWLKQHRQAIDLARRAGQMPALGFVLGPGGSQDDPVLFAPPQLVQQTNQPLLSLMLPHLNGLRVMGRILSLDARRAAEEADGPAIETDLNAMLGLARQLRNSDGVLVTERVALAIDDLANSRLQWILRNHPSSLTSEQLTRLAHTISGPRVAADLMSLRGERCFFADVVQRAYTDNGHGDGHLTLSGLRETMLPLRQIGNDSSNPTLFEVASTVPLLTASRAELLTTYDQLLDQAEADYHHPRREIQSSMVDSKLIAWKTSAIDKIRYAMIDELAPSLDHVQIASERYVGARDGTEVGIALELYRRIHGGYPATLAELTPTLLPEIPADRITGDPVQYRLIDGQPIVYSVGADRIDDGGTPPADPRGSSFCTAAIWGQIVSHVPKGDWVLYPESRGTKSSM
jgi:hypothetical protein